MVHEAGVLALTGKAADAVQMITRDLRMAVNGINVCIPSLLIIFGEQPMPTLANSMMLGAALAKR